MNILEGYAKATITPILYSTVVGATCGALSSIVSAIPVGETCTSSTDSDGKQISKKQFEKECKKKQVSWVVCSTVGCAVVGFGIGAVLSATIHTVTLVASSVLSIE
ncbi:MAG: hypothetical protein VX777_09845 [Chlamydiota bacterium]|nr:hypothetical protein [Chlamydiota bacterium]